VRILRQLWVHAVAEGKDAGRYFGRVMGGLALGAVLSAFVFACYLLLRGSGVAIAMAVIYVGLRALERWSATAGGIADNPQPDHAPLRGRVVTIARRQRYREKV
jgi:hypothetical protein